MTKQEQFKATYMMEPPKPGKVVRIVTRRARATAGLNLQRDTYQFARHADCRFQAEGAIYLLVSHKDEKHLRALWQRKLWKQRPAGTRTLIYCAWDGQLDPIAYGMEHG